MPSPSSSLLAEVEYNGEIMRALDVINLLSALDPSIPLTTSEAALFLRSSVSCLERSRKKGDGPDYFQGGAKGANGTNQPCLYFKEDLASYQKANKVSSSMEAAVKKGQTFATIHDLVNCEAFYVDKNGNVESMVEENILGTVVERIGKWNIVWLNAIEAASNRWKTISAHKKFAHGVQSVLKHASQSIDAGMEATDIASVMSDAPSRDHKMIG